MFAGGRKVNMNEPIAADKNIITSYSPQTANDVAFIMLERLLGKEKPDMVIANLSAK